MSGFTWSSITWTGSMKPGEQHLWYVWGYDVGDIVVAYPHPVGANSLLGIHEVKLTVNLVAQEQEDGTRRSFLYVNNVGTGPEEVVEGYSIGVGYLYS